MKRLKKENWIWLNNKEYPEYQKTYISHWCDRTGFNYCVAEFKRGYDFEKKIEKLVLRVSGDTIFRLYLNDEYVGDGPAKEGRDFFSSFGSGTLLDKDFKMKRYSDTYTLYPGSDKLEFYARVQLSPVRMNDASRGHGGFMLTAIAYFEDGTDEIIQTDSTWLSRRATEYEADSVYNQSNKALEWSYSDETENIWNTVDQVVPPLATEKILPTSEQEIVLQPGETKTVRVFFDMVYSAFMAFDVNVNGFLDMHVWAYEINDSRSSDERMTFKGNTTYIGMKLHSIAAYKLELSNNSMEQATVRPYAVAANFPVTDEGAFRCSDRDLTRVYDVAKHTTKICRQTIHLDSPMHQEPLACTGDYYIESLITAMCFGDMRLAEGDVLKTADILRATNGKMFHTTYSLIWVQMLYDTYMFTGKTELLSECADALHILLNRFNGYIGENGIIDNPPDYMFIDWVTADDFTLHHPPKALGQTCLNAYYHGALVTASEICAILGDKMANTYAERAKSIKIHANELLFDEERGIYFDGLNTPYEPSTWLPANTDKRYYSKQSNTLAVLYGLCDEEKGRDIIRKILNDNTLIDVQPYFMHFTMSAIRKVGLFEECGIRELAKWKEPTKNFPKGMQEGWMKPGPGYSFDYSHAWGGTPAYQLPVALLGLEMVEAGYKKIRLSPKLYGYDYAYISVPTKYGYITCSMKKGQKTQINVPEEIEVVE